MIPTVHAGNDFGGLLDYLQKPGHSLLEPLDIPVEQVIEQMTMVAELSTRCTRPVKHLTFSAAREDGRLDGDCQEFRVRAGIMGKKETPYVPTQRACDTE